MRLFIASKQNIDQIATHAKKAGVTLDSEPHDTEWKTRAFGVTEPSGFKVTISSRPLHAAWPRPRAARESARTLCVRNGGRI